jgi:hypothetical protein
MLMRVSRYSSLFGNLTCPVSKEARVAHHADRNHLAEEKKDIIYSASDNTPVLGYCSSRGGTARNQNMNK